MVTGKQNLCRGRQVGISDATGQNGKVHENDLTLKAPACPAAKTATKKKKSTV